MALHSFVAGQDGEFVFLTSISCWFCQRFVCFMLIVANVARSLIFSSRARERARDNLTLYIYFSHFHTQADRGKIISALQYIFYVYLNIGLKKLGHLTPVAVTLNTQSQHFPDPPQSKLLSLQKGRYVHFFYFSSTCYLVFCCHSTYHSQSLIAHATPECRAVNVIGISKGSLLNRLMILLCVIRRTFYQAHI